MRITLNRESWRRGYLDGYSNLPSRATEDQLAYKSGRIEGAVDREAGQPDRSGDLLALKQAVGRFVRTETDRLVILDPIAGQGVQPFGGLMTDKLLRVSQIAEKVASIKSCDNFKVELDNKRCVLVTWQKSGLAIEGQISLELVSHLESDEVLLDSVCGLFDTMYREALGVLPAAALPD